MLVKIEIYISTEYAQDAQRVTKHIVDELKRHSGSIYTDDDDYIGSYSVSGFTYQEINP